MFLIYQLARYCECSLEQHRGQGTIKFSNISGTLVFFFLIFFLYYSTWCYKFKGAVCKSLLKKCGASLQAECNGQSKLYLPNPTTNKVSSLNISSFL